MKFFTREWHSGSLSDLEADKIPAAYAQHTSTLMPRMPAALRALATGSVNLHDGLIRKITLDPFERTLIVALRCGDLQEGYFDVDLLYEKIHIEASDLKELNASANDPKTEVLYDEVDLNPEGQWVHRILFWPYRETCIVFGKLGLHLQPRENREFTKDRP